jgi:hypothetical protein
MRYHLGSTSNTVCKQMWHRSTMVDHQELTFKMSKVVPKEVLTMLDRSDGHDMAIKIHTTPVWKPKKWLCIVKTSWDRGLSPVVSRQSFVVICNYRLFTKHLRNILCQLIGFAYAEEIHQSSWLCKTQQDVSGGWLPVIPSCKQLDS